MRKFHLSLGIMVLASLLFANPALAQVDSDPLPGPRQSERLKLIRLYNPTINDHLYTSSQAEADAAVANYGYRIEGVMGYVERYQQDATQSIYRMWNPSTRKHFYTTNYQEVQSAQGLGYVLETGPGFMLVFFDAVPSASDPLWQGRVPVYRLYNAGQNKHFYTINTGERDHLIANGGYVSENELGSGLFNSPTVEQ